MITVIIPTYNRENELRICLDGLLKQSYKDYEIIVISDGSSDCTEQLVKTYKNVRYFKQVCHRGTASTRNIGIKQAKGDIIAFIDDDCIPDKDWLRNALPHFQYTEIVGVEGLTVSSDLEITPTSMQTINHYGKKYPTCNIFYKTSLLKEINGFNTAFKFAGEDADLAFRMLKKGKIKFVTSVKVFHPVKNYSVKGFLKKHLSIKRTYWQVLCSKSSKQLYAWESLIYYPLYAGVLLLILNPNIFSLLLLSYIYLTTVIIHDLYLTKGRVLDIFKCKKTLMKLVLVWWIIIIHDTFFRIAGIIRFRRILL